MKTRSQKKQELAKKREDESKKTTSIRLSSNERSIVEQKAAAKGMAPTAYIAYAAVHGSDGISPAEKVRFQNAINHAAAALEQYDPEKAAKIRMEGDSIWDL